MRRADLHRITLVTIAAHAGNIPCGAALQRQAHDA
jgi:hypothetical protein